MQDERATTVGSVLYSAGTSSAQVAAGRRSRFPVIIVLVLAITSLTSHLVARNFRLVTNQGPPLHFQANPQDKDTAIAAGSSLTFYGIAWPKVAGELHAKFYGLEVTYGSAHEVEVLRRDAPPAKYTFLGISAFDSNEHSVSDLRAQIVPFEEEVRDLWVAHSDWAHAKKVLSQYPLVCIRWVFPTAGRSSGVTAGLKALLIGLVRRGRTAPALDQPAVTEKNNGHTDDITAWPADQIRRSVAVLAQHDGRSADFRGTKRDSLLRFLRYSASQGKVIVAVIPESPIYRREFATAEAQRRFEDLINEAQRTVPEVQWVRLDRLKELDSNTRYWDLVHLNAVGQSIATEALVAQLANADIR